MHSLKFAFSAFLGCAATMTVAAAGTGDIDDGIQVEARRDFKRPLVAHQITDPGPCGMGPGELLCMLPPSQAALDQSYTTVPVSDLINAINAKETAMGGPSISARQAQSEATVTVTVTTTPDYCNTAPSAGTSPVSVGASPSAPASGPANPSITGPAVIIPIPVSTPGAGPVSAGTSLPMFGNVTMATSSMSSTGSSTSSVSSTLTSGSASNSAPATSSPSAPQSNGSDSKNFYGVLLAVGIALTGNVALLI